MGGAALESGLVNPIARRWAGLRSLLAKQHAPKARPSPVTVSGRRVVGQAVKREWLRRFDLRGGGLPDIRA